MRGSPASVAPDLPPEPGDRIVPDVDDALLQRDDRVVGDRDVLGADFRAALGDVAQAVIGWPSGNVFIRVMHMRRGMPFTSGLHEPHLPALQFQRTARSLATVAWTRWITSRTTSPSSAATT